MRYLNKLHVRILIIGLTLFYVIYTLPILAEFRDKVTREYFKHKEFLFKLKNAPRDLKKPAQEAEIEEKLKNLGLNIKAIYRTDSGVEVTLKNLHWNRIPYIILLLEKQYEIVSFSAVDNTGKGLFEVRIVFK